MANILHQSYIIPVSFREMNKTAIPQYMSRFMDDWTFRRTIKSWEQDVCWAQPWQKSDSVRLQFISNYAPLSIRLFHIDGRPQGYQANFDTKQQDLFRPGYYIRQIEIDLSQFDEGFYYWVINTGTSLVLVSDPQEIAEEHPNTLYVEYKTTGRYEGVYFDAPYLPAVRIPANIKFDLPNGRRTTYTNERYNQTMLKQVSYRQFILQVGGGRGVPPSFIDKLNGILGCENVAYDGRLFTVADGEEWSKEELENYPMPLFSIGLREKINREAIRYENEIEIIGTNNMMVVLNTKGFGVDESGGDYQEIIDVE